MDAKNKTEKITLYLIKASGYFLLLYGQLHTLQFIQETYRFHCTTALAAAIASITNVAVRYDMKASITKIAEPSAHLKLRLYMFCSISKVHHTQIMFSDSYVEQITLLTYPTSLNALGIVRAPVPTIRLNI